MDRRLTLGFTAAVLLVGASVSWRMRPASAPSAPGLGIQFARVEAPNPNLEICLRHVRLVHDVTWASACMKLAVEDGATDGSADCTLPDWRAAPLNSALDFAEQRCYAEGGRTP